MSFDRLVGAVDTWAESASRGDVLAQIGTTAVVPKAIQSVANLAPDAFRKAVQDAEVVVAHAGMGSILTAMEYGKPLVVMPRKGALFETRNDHQVATCQWLNKLEGVFVADDERGIASAMECALACAQARTPISTDASDSLLQGIRQFIQEASQ